jgi:hypothetical protein
VLAALLVTACASVGPIGTLSPPDDPEAGTFKAPRHGSVPIRAEALTYTGKGRFEWPDGRRYEGTFISGKPSGQGVEQMPSGERYEGGFRDGVRDGQGDLTLPDGARYVGAFEAGVRSGDGRFETKDGVYDGEWAGDVPHGEGTFEYKDGSRYRGEWAAGRRQGFGRYEQADGSFYEGDWAGDMPNGFGHMSETNGADYDGAWEHAQRNGYGRMSTRAGVVYTGTWVADQRDGFGREERPDGTRYTGEWHGGERNGWGLAEALSGSTHEGLWKDGLPVGQGTRRSDEGIEISGNWSSNEIATGRLVLPSGRSYRGKLYDAKHEIVDAALVRWLKTAAEGGDPHAALLLGEAYRHFKDPAPDPEAAVRWYKRAAAAGLAEGRYQLAELELESGDNAPAIELLEAAADQKHPASAARLGALYQLGDRVEKSHARAKQYYEVALEKGHVVARNNLAWLLATSPDPALRDGARAVELIRPLAYFTEDWGYLDTLAAAYAETGDFTAAIDAQRSSLSRAEGQAGDADMKELQSRLAMYERQEPYHEPN